MTKMGVYAAAVALAVVSVSASATPLVTNGGFETGDFTGWTTANDPFFQFVDPAKPHTGEFAAHMGVNPTSIAPGTFADLQQTIATVAGHTYQFSFWLDVEPGSDGGAGSQFKASFDGATLLDLTNPAAQGYTKYTFDVVASGSTAVVDFQHYNDFTHFFLDDVAVGAVPEPATLLLLGAGLAGIGAARRRSKKNA